MPEPAPKHLGQEITVCMIEDDPEISGHLAFLLQQAPGIRFLQSFSNCEDALREIPKLRPSVALMDIQLPGMDGIEGVRQLKATCPDTQILMLTVYDDPERIFQALAAGASGYLLKRTSLPQLLDAIREVHSGGAPFSGNIARKIVQFFQTPASLPPAEPAALGDLTPREREILDRLAHGDMYKEIADKLGIALDTVRKHVRSIYQKLHVRTRTEAVVKYLAH
jgi:DNA-binding NarL/FixJ family response regulator